MVLILFFVVAFGFVVSLIPFIYPGSIMNTFGAFLNVLLGTVLVSTLGIGLGSLAAGSPGGYALTLQGVLAVYAPILVILLVALRSR